MVSEQNASIPPGWVGGFAQSNPAFAYPTPDLSSLPMLDNMDNIDKLQRQQPVKWPEFSWQVEKGDEKSRCFQMFAPYISRIGYTNEGRVYSIICPQQGLWLKNELCLNVEVTVTGQRGWVDESTRLLAADMTVEGKIWFTPGQYQGSTLKKIWPLLELLRPELPLKKATAIRVSTHHMGEPSQPIFPLLSGESKRFTSPEFARHENEAWDVANIEVEIGPIHSTGNEKTDKFNKLVMEAFNLGSGNMLQNGNILTWNVWFQPPGLVDREEWRTHAERWRESIDAHHGSPDGEGTVARYFDGTPFNAKKEAVEEILERIIKYLSGAAKG